MTRERHKRGMTLIELLVGISIATVVLIASVSVYLVVTSSLRRQQKNTRETAYAVLEQVRHDLAACAQAPSTNIPPFLLECAATGTNVPVLAALSFSTGTVPEPQDDFSKLEIRRIRYSVVPTSPGQDREEGGVLTRETTTLWGTDALAPAVSNPVMSGVTAFDVQVYAGSAWTNEWKSSGGTLMPCAARIRLDWRTATTSETASVEVFIPAGNPVAGAGSQTSGTRSQKSE